MSLLVDTPVMALNKIQRQAFYTLFAGLNGFIAAAESALHDSDVEFEAITGRTLGVRSIERIAPDNFVEGYKPTLIDAPITAYPNCSVWTTRATGLGTDYDHIDVFNISLFVEVMVKSSPDEGEDLVNQRATYTADAAHACLKADESLGGLIFNVGVPTANLSGVFTRKEQTAYGPHWFWQSCRLEYAVRKEAAIYQQPSSESIFRAAGLNIDQA